VYYLDFFFIHPVYFPPLIAKPGASGVPKLASGAPSPTKVNKTRLEKKKKKRTNVAPVKASQFIIFKSTHTHTPTETGIEREKMPRFAVV
jgi:hypothetical protein